MSVQEKVRGIWVLLCLVSAFVSSSALADTDQGWDVTVGVGVQRSSVYTGSDDYYVGPVPIVQATYTTGAVSFYGSVMDGIGVKYVSREHSFFTSAGVAFGEERDSEEYSVLGRSRAHSKSTRTLLMNSPNVSTPVSVSATLGYLTSAGVIGASVGYHPTSVDYTQAGREDTTFQGLLYSVFYSREYQVAERSSFSAMLNLDFMNQAYADAWYAVPYETDALDLFHADAGLKSGMVALQVTRMVSEHMALSLIGCGTRLLGDAAKSPYTVDTFQPTIMVYLTYTF